MLSQSNRLPAAIKLKHSKFRKTILYTLKFAQNDLAVSRFAFIVRKSVDKRAVFRNRIKRVFRSCIERNLTKIASGYDMLFFLEKGIIDKSQTELEQIIIAELQEARILQ